MSDTPDAPLPARRRADAMVGLFIGAVVALLAGIAALVTTSGVLGAGLVVIALFLGLGGVLLLRSISPEERAALTAPKEPAPEAEDG